MVYNGYKSDGRLYIQFSLREEIHKNTFFLSLALFALKVSCRPGFCHTSLPSALLWQTAHKTKIQDRQQRNLYLLSLKDDAEILQGDQLNMAVFSGSL